MSSYLKFPKWWCIFASSKMRESEKFSRPLKRLDLATGRSALVSHQLRTLSKKKKSELYIVCCKWSVSFHQQRANHSNKSSFFNYQLRNLQLIRAVSSPEWLKMISNLILKYNKPYIQVCFFLLSSQFQSRKLLSDRSRPPTEKKKKRKKYPNVFININYYQSAPVPMPTFRNSLVDDLQNDY